MDRNNENLNSGENAKQDKPKLIRNKKISRLKKDSC